jgi:hypothetical protein
MPPCKIVRSLTGQSNRDTHRSGRVVNRVPNDAIRFKVNAREVDHDGMMIEGCGGSTSGISTPMSGKSETLLNVPHLMFMQVMGQMKWGGRG